MSTKGPAPLVSVVIPSYGRIDAVTRCLESVKRSVDTAVEVIVVTSGYSEADLSRVAALADKVVELPVPVQVSESRNLGAAEATGALLLFVDDDNVVGPDCVSLLARTMIAGQDLSLVGPVMYYMSEPDKIWCAGVSRSTFMMRTHFRTTLPASEGPLLHTDDLPNCFMVRREQFEAVAGFDARLFPRHFEESDLAKRLEKAGFGSAAVVREALIWHDISTDLFRRMHMQTAETAYVVARSRNLFAAVHGSMTQRIVNRWLSRWVLAAVYVFAALRADPGRRGRAIARSYLRGCRRVSA